MRPPSSPAPSGYGSGLTDIVIDDSSSSDSSLGDDARMATRVTVRRKGFLSAYSTRYEMGKIASYDRDGATVFVSGEELAGIRVHDFVSYHVQSDPVRGDMATNVKWLGSDGP